LPYNHAATFCRDRFWNGIDVIIAKEIDVTFYLV